MSRQIILKNVAKLPADLTKDELLDIFRMYTYQDRNGAVVNNWLFSKKIGYLPPNRDKLDLVAAMIGAEIVDQRCLGKPLSAPFQLNPEFNLRSYQVEPAGQFIEYLQQNYYGMLQGETGSGKTSVTSFTVGHLNCKILVLCDMGSLLSQWQAAFKGVWGKDAQILKSGDSTFADVCVATFQLLNLNRELLDRIYDEFGCVVTDECHVQSAEKWKHVLLSINSKYKAGISATIFRKGYSDEILTDLIGPIVVEMADEDKIIPQISFAFSNVLWYSSNPDDFSRTLSKLAADEQRNMFLLSLLKEAVKMNRKIVLVAPTIKCLKGLYEDSKGWCRGRLYVGSTTLQQDLALKSDLASGKINVIFTAKKLNKGVDLKNLDYLILATPTNNKAQIIQIVGRLLRKAEGKPQPIVVDVIDNSELAQCFARNRKKWYIEQGFQIRKETQ
jgi:superfamily II DNA or RNA helicase